MKNPNSVDAKQIFQSPQMFLAFGFGSGLSRVVPGTVGTAAAVPLYLLMAQLPPWGYAIAVLLGFVLGVYLCSYASAKLVVHDHSGVVWDEFVGFWVTMFLVPFSWYWLLAGFILFRFFDMVKPWPISLVDEKVHGGFGIMLDDVLAGAAAWLCLQVLIRLL